MNKRGAARDSRVGISWNAARPEDTRGAFPDARPLPPATSLRRAVRLYTATALAGGLLSAFAFATPAAAQASGGAGGSGAFGSGGPGGAAGQPGGDSTCTPPFDFSNCQVPGGAVGTAPGGSGGNGSTGPAGPGSGGGGGADGSLAAPIGGNGGNGGDGQSGNRSNGGGGGGGGGNGVVLSTALVNSGLVRGGHGGNGGGAGAGGV
jgi:fibronectin-binding autotransporter adhesin